MKRRSAVLYALGLGSGAAAWALWQREGFWNKCLPLPLPNHLAQHEIVQAAWSDLDATKVWDTHVHLTGLGEGASRVWVNPEMLSVLNPFEFVHAQFYANAACVTAAQIGASDPYVERLIKLQQPRPAGAKLMLLALDYLYDESGKKNPSRTVFYAPNDYASQVAASSPTRFEWVASVHPYRVDWLEALEWAHRHNARAIKWLPSAMGIDPSSSKCHAFYNALVRLKMPLICHGGYEHPLLDSSALQHLNNPLALRPALAHGVRVILAHCASTGSSVDTDRGKQGRVVENFELFTRLMADPRYVGLLFGDISAITEASRVGGLLRFILEKSDWHGRLLNGSDYPLPGYTPEISVDRLVQQKFITSAAGQVLREMRHYDPLLFDFVLKRQINSNGQRFANSVFETATFFS